ncbi:TPA: hypothetical protein ACH3X1_007848 [Trebouxia sp. C0004]
MSMQRLSREAVNKGLHQGVVRPVAARLFHASTAVQADNQIECKVNGESVHVPKGSTVMHACDAAGIDIPRFCYHQKLSIAGSCRMCLVEVTKSPKPVASCAMPAGPGMDIKTDTPLVKKAREGVMEFLLINHPLDCPICDQGGECDLQDQAMQFGSDRGRFTEMKRAVEDKNLGPLVKTVMNRCVQDLGVTGRGRDSEIGTYVEKLMTSELSGNVIDLCPVGALTSKPFAFTARNWELKSTESIDVSDALGSNTKIDSRGVEVMRITPRLNESINEEWLSDKGRFSYDGLKRQRLNIPLVKSSKGYRSVLWPDALKAVAEGLKGVKGNEMKAIAGKLADAEAMVALKDLMNRMGSGNLYSEGGFPDLDADVRSNYIMNTTLMGVEKADAILLIGSNPRIEAPVFNARIRKTTLEGCSVSVIGENVDLTYPYDYLGEGAADLSRALKDEKFMQSFKEAKYPVVLVGPGILQRADRNTILQQVHQLVEEADVVREGWNGYNVFHDNASRVAALDVGFLPSARASSAPPAKFVYLLGSDDYQEEDIPQDAFVVYQGHHGDRGALRANVVLPAPAYTEKAVTYVNTEGRPQRTKEAVPMPGDAREDWKIVRALSEYVGNQLPYDTINELRERMADVAPHLAKNDTVESPMWLNGEYFKAFAEKVMKSEQASKEPFKSSIDNFYQTDSITRSSSVMAKCVQARKNMHIDTLSTAEMSSK